jgi:Spy/CpxP family protein refolding chaperone
MNNNNPPADWAWPALIQSLQRDIGQLRELMDEARRETIQVREIHRKELDALIDQLRSVREQLNPIVKEREDSNRLSRETRWSWIERTGWVVIGGLALAAWHFIKENLRR